MASGLLARLAIPIQRPDLRYKVEVRDPQCGYGWRTFGQYQRQEAAESMTVSARSMYGTARCLDSEEGVFILR